MPALKHTRHEAFAQARAEGMIRRAVRAAAGYSPGGPGRLDHWTAVRARTVKLRPRQEALLQAGLEHTVLAMLDLAAPEERMSGAGRKEARMARLEAHRLNDLLMRQREQASYVPPREMTEDEWMAKYGAPAPMPT